MSKNYDYIIVGAGIAGCSVAYFLSQYSKSILLIDRNCDIAQGASGAAGAFLSPLLGKPNDFKELVTKALKFSTNFYLENIKDAITNCGVLRIPKNEEDREKFESYKPYMDFPYQNREDGYFFEIGSQVSPYETCKFLTKNIETLLNYEVNKVEKEEEFWSLNDEFKAKNLILTTGADISLIREKYFNIRAVWGQKIDILTSTKTTINYHKECSLSHSKYIEKENKYLSSIGATHHRIDENLKICNHCLDSFKNETSYNKKRVEEDCNKLLTLASDIKILENIEICDIKIGPRASSVDYFPMVGKLIDSQTTLIKYPHLKNGSHVKSSMLSAHDNLYVLNGVGGRGFVLSPYLAHTLVEHIINQTEINKHIKTDRMFSRWVKKLN
ncbi:FAD-dependent oxidoreductase [Halarcobacter ebronensis]|uniref:D-amino-acid oxidase n=1 Tax=Halarcobacter ebronensis TaxID=1462615 RepID=A0A4Q1AT59_9BACT|nr:FAD-dependent oxidoreductase [Halarcobacter ebronensis]QKF82255.1 FAD-dependent oxidoreductase, possible FAD-dependent cmnm(5)s(2)U34 oxidoreductase [Halarcobacter ebronensis]RXK07711.1 D-amino-acid oxidase [Halarcobacter ebronensis]